MADRPVNIYASRFGWMATANMILCVLFALRNAPLTSTSMPHADLKTVHIALGYISGVQVVVHAILYTIFFGRQTRWDELIEASNLMGIGAGVATAVLMFGIWRHRNYELFYISHFLGYASLLVMLFLHRPGWFRRPKLPLLVIIMASMWLMERVVRFSRMVRNLVRGAGRVTVQPLPGGGVRLLLKTKSRQLNATAGSHCFLWIPQVSWYQTHPFTIVSSGPQGVELVVKSFDGFTKELYELARDTADLKCSRERAILASIDGPYGSSSLPDTTKYDKLAFVAGGSGAAFTFGLINRILDGDGFNKNNRHTVQSIDFVWAVRNADMLTWFREHSVNIASSPNINVTIYITDGHSESSETTGINSHVQGTVMVDDVEVGEMESLLSRHSHYSGCRPSVEYVYAKMNTDTVIQTAMQTVGEDDRVLVAGCGPGSLTKALQKSVEGHQDRSKNASRVDFYSEYYES
ncbi:hypothetical protein Sste5346_004589 [Sporothrix stenoceras]|uniref:ferric-chelate reductase (NADPH) n=1 Tax=Sporothrix stenoceras TaxID=5173 RepID=A0ABR3Z860_9PEZI